MRALPGTIMKKEVPKIMSEVNEKIPSMDDFKDELEASFKEHARTKRVDMSKWEKVLDDFENKNTIEVEVAEAVKSGVTATIDGLRAFIPASKLSLGFVKDEELKDFVGKKLNVRIITAEPENNKLVLSARDVLRDEQEKAKEEKAQKVQVGLVTEGKVDSIKDYGAFVDIGEGVTGLLHVSQISNKRIKSPSEVLKEGETVQVQVIAIKDGKISLSMKSLETERKERKEKEEREDFRANYKESGAATTSLGDLFKKSGIKFS
jgi:small subunit ribosomal protein S1